MSCRDRSKLFKQLTAEKTGIHFNNVIEETDSINVIDFENVYNGGGVGVADFNNDQKIDIYFSGNLVSNKLYLNNGGMNFRDATDAAGVTGNGKWSRGVTTVDINNDGWMDLYITVTAKETASERENLLYVNQGVDENGIPHFRDMAKEYGLHDTTHSTMAAFFDYDNDRDLDVFIATNEIIDGDFPNRFRQILADGSHPGTDKLYRNDWSDSLSHPVFTDVSREAGILIEGYSHNVTVTDLNLDGWKDIYVTNDYLSSNILYINNGNGTFTDKVREYFKHTSANAMGSDVIDVNNDGLSDVIELDMNPQDNYRKKMMLNPNSYQTYQNLDYFGYHYQYVRNTFQLNQGFSVKKKDSIGDPVFSDIGFFSGIAETDWSWSPVVADFDNDGFRDIIITNGFPKDVTDHDFISYRNEAFAIASKQQLLEQIPEVKIHNYAYQNNGDLRFNDVTRDWGFESPSFSNGAAYADLDNDGDLDVVINNINDKAFVYENLVMNSDRKENYLRIDLRGDSLNRNGIGAWVEIYYKGKKQVYEQTPVRGYLSSIQIDPHFGLGSDNVIDSVLIKWPDLKTERILNVKSNQTIVADWKNATSKFQWTKPVLTNALFHQPGDETGIVYTHEERDFIDFNIQKLLPHKFSEYGPALAAGDIDNNGYDDLIVGGSFSHSAVIFFQSPNGSFQRKDLIPNASNHNKRWEDMGIVLFDADADHDLDIYIASGGYENDPGSDAYQDRFYINEDGNFKIDTLSIPHNRTSKSCVRASDFDKDGDLDLFVGGRVQPWEYPKPVSGFIYRNDSKNGAIKFIDITATVAPALINAGLICDALWTDFNNDGWQDLIIAGEWMPLTFLKNEGGTFKDVTKNSGVSDQSGWWNSLSPGDFDNDGDIDYIVGNLGLNSFYRASDKQPVKIYAKDFDNNGSYDAIPTLYLKPTLGDHKPKEYPAQTRDDLVKQMTGFRAKFTNYRTFATSPVTEMFTDKELEGALIMQVNNFRHSLMKNIGNGKFEMIPLPTVSQFSCVNGIVADDFDQDGNIDLVINGNDYGTEVSVGRYDACNGLFLKGKGDGGFEPLSITESGVFIPGNGKALVKLMHADSSFLLAASQNRGEVKIFKPKLPGKVIKIAPNESSAVIKFKNGFTRKEEFNYGASFLSQSSRYLNIRSGFERIEISDISGKKRVIIP